MNRDDIERMAVEAGGGTPEWDGIWELSEEALKRFYALAVAAERKACAIACEKISESLCRYDNVTEGRAAQDCAEAIWARGE